MSSTSSSPLTRRACTTSCAAPPTTSDNHQRRTANVDQPDPGEAAHPAPDRDGRDQLAHSERYAELEFTVRLGLLVDREAADRNNRRLARNLKTARLRAQACIEDIDFRRPRGLDRTQILRLADADWVTDHHDLVISGATGCGKTYLACALAQAAIRRGHKALYWRLPRLLDELHIAHADGRVTQLMTSWARVDVLILDDLGLRPLTTAQTADLLEVIEDRHGRRSTIITSQLPINTWHDNLGDPTLADAICDRILHTALRIELRGEPMRKPPPQDPSPPAQEPP
jgi:DNA replication protein DnaC